MVLSSKSPIGRTVVTNRSLLWIAIGAFSVFSFVFLLASKREHVIPLRIGQSFPESPAEDIDGQPVKWPNGPFVVLYSEPDSGTGIQIAKYLQIRLKTRHGALPVIGILNGATGKQAAIGSFQREVGPSFPLIIDDGKWADNLHTHNRAFFLFIVDAQKHVLFSSNRAEQEDIRQLSEKYVTGHITYSDPIKVSALKIGDKLSSFATIDLHTGQPVEWDPAPDRSVIFFTARCPECSMEYQLISISKFEHAHPNQAAQIIVFSSRFPREDLLRAASQLGIKARLLQAKDSIPSIEDAYDLEIYTPTDISIVAIGKGGEAVKLLSLDDYLHSD